MIKGIDVSKHNGMIDWAKVKAAGIKFAMLRAGYGKNNVDTQFKRNASECNRLGIPIGVYWFSYAYTEEMAKKEAEYCLAAIKAYKLEYPVCFDLEYDTVKYAKRQGVTINKSLATKLTKAFCGKIEAAGYYAMIYANKDYLTNMFDPGLLKSYDLWYARYSASCDRSDVGIWQYSESGTVNGIKSVVDMNYGYKDYPSIIRAAGLNGFKKAVTKAPSAVDTAAKTVQEKAGLEDSTMKYLREYKYGDDLLKKLAAAMK